MPVPLGIKADVVKPPNDERAASTPKPIAAQCLSDTGNMDNRLDHGA